MICGTDLMVGFPDEDEQAFANTVRTVERLPFSYFHVFSYSARPGTAAARQEAQIPPAVIRQRSKALAELSRTKALAFYQQQIGRTLPVLGSGIDRIYPAEHRRLAAGIAERGAVLTEFPLGAAPERWHFPMRNRLVSGLSRAVVVVEAAEKSGALITADAALEQGREVFAVPGAVTAPTSAGPNRLIKQGATLAEDARDVLEGTPGLAGRIPDAAPRLRLAETTAEERRILAGLAEGPQPIDALVRAGDAPAAATAALLTALEVKGLVRQHPGNRFGLA